MKVMELKRINKKRSNILAADKEKLESKKDQQELIEQFKHTIDKGELDSIFDYANILRTGSNIKENPEEAVRYFKLTANKGHVMSMYNIAVMLRDGDKIEMNEQKAIKYFELAAEHGHYDSFLKLIDDDWW